MRAHRGALGERMDVRLDYPATGRNREPILEVLRRVLPARGVVLELASGSGQHAAYFARQLPHLTWQPTDVEEPALASIAAWTAHEALPNVLPPIRLSATDASWPPADAVFCANLVHIAPWEVALGLLAGASRSLGSGAPLVLYGPYRVGGAHTAPSNEAFDASLRARNPAWGVRDVEAVVAEADARGFVLAEMVQMPANNLTLVLRKR
jgi:hypothetical protein